MKTLTILLTCTILFCVAQGQPEEWTKNKSPLPYIVNSSYLDTVQVSLVIGRSGKYLEDVMGYDVRKYMPRADTPVLSESIHIKYLDYRKHSMPKGIIVWMSKEIK